MSVLENLEPQKVFYYFEQLCAIPHGSGNTKQISDYCVNFAKEHNLRYIQDASNNVILFKDGSAGYETSEPVILQGHLDMVCEKEPDCLIDFEKEGLDLRIDGDWIYARGTTLGGDDGIAVAYALAVLDDETLAHPPLEVVFTVDEEIGMLGAQAIDLSMLKGRRLLNIDSEEEGSFLTSCAGGMQATVTIPVSYREEEGLCYQLTVENLVGGHSGSEIDKERANAIVLLGRCLDTLQEAVDIEISAMEGGQKDNAIPRRTICQFLVSEENAEEVERVVEQLQTVFRKEYAVSDPDVTLSLEKKNVKKMQVLDFKSKAKILYFLRTAPNGVQNYSMALPGLVETSLNAGIMKLNAQKFFVVYSIRSSVQTRKYDLLQKLKMQAAFLGGIVSVEGDYPAWEYKEKSDVRKAMAEAFFEVYHKEPKFEAIHAGLECGLFSDKLEGLDAVSFGPNILDIHTTQEKLSISSTQRVWNLLREALKRLK